MNRQEAAPDLERDLRPLPESPESPSTQGVPEEASVAFASQWKLVWWRFRRHRLALVGLVVIGLIYLTTAFAEFVAPHDPRATDRIHQYAPPQLPRFVDAEGRFHLRPFVYAMEREIDMRTMRRTWSVDTSERYPVALFVRGEPYRLWGLVPTDVRLFGTIEGVWYPLGTDGRGRDMLSRIIHGARISTTIGLLGVTISLVVGLILGGFSGYLGGIFDTFVQRLIELIIAIPTLPLFMALSAAMPPWWPQTTRFFVVVAILSLIGWTGVAREARGKFLAMREEDFVMAARFAGASQWRIVVRHMLPSFASHIIATASLAIPGMILGETALSFLGLGLQAPTISWGVLLQQAQNIQSVALYPWLLIPGLFVVVTVLAFNFVGDGLRDAADPYAQA